MNCASSPRNVGRRLTHWRAALSSWAASMATVRQTERYRVGQTLQTALGDPEIAELVRSGRLNQAVTYGGFGPTDLASAFGAPPPPRHPAGRISAARRAGTRADPKQRREAEKAAAEARERAAAAARLRSRRSRRQEAATQHADEQADQVESLRSQLRQAEAAEREAREAARTASTTRSCGRPRSRPSRTRTLRPKPSRSVGRPSPWR